MQRNEFLKLISSPLMNLDHTYRYSGTKLVEEETLSQHIVDTIMMGIKIINEINKMTDQPLSIETYVMKATYHDLEEVITGDIPRPLKYHNEATLSSLRDVADEVAESLFKEQFGDNWKEHYTIWEHAKYDAEGYILKLVDNLVVVNKVIKEVSLLHNYYMLKVAHEVVQYTREIRDNFHLYVYSDDVNKYLLSLLDGAIKSLEDIIDSDKDKIDLFSHSMI